MLFVFVCLAFFFAKEKSALTQINLFRSGKVREYLGRPKGKPNDLSRWRKIVAFHYSQLCALTAQNATDSKDREKYNALTEYVSCSLYVFGAKKKPTSLIVSCNFFTDRKLFQTRATHAKYWSSIFCDCIRRPHTSTKCDRKPSDAFYIIFFSYVWMCVLTLFFSVESLERTSTRFS